jgi:hypothetical protein
MNIAETLDVIRNKGNCFRTIHIAENHLRKLRGGVIAREDYFDISLALHHMELGEGADELNSIISKIKSKYISK